MGDNMNNNKVVTQNDIKKSIQKRKKLSKNEKRANVIRPLFLVVFSIILNMVLSTLIEKLELPIYLDSCGTIIATALGGYLPGIFVALFTNILKGFVVIDSIYYAVVNVLIAALTHVFIQKMAYKKVSSTIVFILVMGVSTALLSFVIGWILYGSGDDGKMPLLMSYLKDNLHMPVFWAEIIMVNVLNVFDKAVTVVLSMAVVFPVAKRFKDAFLLTGWRQNPISQRRLRESGNLKKGLTKSLRSKVVFIVSLTFILLAITILYFSMILFKDHSVQQHKELGYGVTKLISSVIDPERIDEYIEKGEEAEGYKDIEKILYEIRDTTPDVEYVYIYKIMEDGCHVVFDLDSDEFKGGEPGSVLPIEDAFREIMPDLLAGREIEPIISDAKYGWLLTIYTPVYNSANQCVCYAAVDISMEDLAIYERDFVVKLLSLFLGFFVFVIALAVWLANYNIIIPINTMALASNSFAYESDEMREKNVERIMRLGIKTGDEVENLYSAMVKTTNDSMSYVLDIQEKNKTISDMQSALIVVIADMVENRDKSTGDHIKKTAEYTRIAMEAMREKGYYKDQLTDEFIEDVVRSAPLHDVGKISVSDTILNKPGRLTDEEYDIMKTHTIAGKFIIEEAMQAVPDSSYLAEASNIAFSHHEKWDGSGYPRGLKGEDIPLSARVMAVADVFDALVSRRCYKEPFSFEKAMNIIKSDAGTHFDPLVADAFIGAEEKVRKVEEKYRE